MNELTEEFETEVYAQDVMVGGVFSAGNVVHGSVVITPTPNTPTFVTVSGLDLSGSGRIIPLVSAKTSVPWTRVREVSVAEVTESSFRVYIYRTNNTATRVHYLAYREPEEEIVIP